jgi:ribonuclease E
VTTEITADEGDTDEEESDDQPGMVRTDQPAGGERRPRRRGRRGGRRRRGGPDDGLAGSITDELAPIAASEAAGAVADFDGYSAQAPSPALAHPASAPSEPQHMDRGPEAVRSPSEVETAQEAERTARRRSTVREKVSFLVGAQPEAPTAPVDHSQAEPSSPTAQPAAEPASAPAENGQPRRAGWWSRRFGNGE